MWKATGAQFAMQDHDFYIRSNRTRMTEQEQITNTSAPSDPRRRYSHWSLIAAAIAGGVILLLPEPDGLTPAGKRMAAVFLIALILWSTEALPIAISSLLIVILQPIFKVAELRTAFNTFISPVFFFVIAMFLIAEAFMSSGLSNRFAYWILGRAGTDGKRVVLAFIVGTAAISTIMSDVPACAIFMAIALGLLNKMEPGPERARIGKALMIAIPMAALIGGVATPAGSSINILGIYLIEQNGGVRVPFLSWMAIGVPLTVAMVPITWLAVVRYTRVQSIRLEAVNQMAGSSNRGPLSAAEKKVIILMLMMIVLWISSTWIKQLDVVLIAIAGSILMFLPGLRLLTWKRAERSIGWDTLFMIGGVTSLGAAAIETGLAKWLVDVSLGGMQGWNVAAIIAAISAFTIVIHLVLPIGPVITAVIIPPITLLALSAGKNPALYGLPVVFSASCAFLMPLDAVPLLTYTTGYYRMFDMVTPGVIISLFWIVLMTLLMVLLAPILGLF